MQADEAQKRFQTMVRNPPADPADAGFVDDLAKTLAALFPLLRTLAGYGFLSGMARDFVLENPPRGDDLLRYAAGFDRHVKGYELARALPHLPDVATFEIAIYAACRAEDDKPLRAVAPAPDHIRPRASVSLIDSRWPLRTMRDFCMKEKRGPEEKINIYSGGEKIMVYRPGQTVEAVALADDEFMMLAALQGGAEPETAAQAVRAAHPDFGLQAFIKRHTGLGSLADPAGRG